MHCADGQIKCLNIRLNPTCAISHSDYSSDFWLWKRSPCSSLLSKSIKKLLLRLVILTLLNLGVFASAFDTGKIPVMDNPYYHVTYGPASM